MTAHVTGEAAERWRDAQMDGYVAKPFTIAQLARELGEVAEPGADATANDGFDADSAEQTADTETPLLSEQMLDMFRSIGASTGSNWATGSSGCSMNTRHPHLKRRSARSPNGAEHDEIARLIHALKSMCNSAGAMRAAAQCEALEQLAKSGQPIPQSDIAELAATVELTCAAMNDERGKMKGGDDEGESNRRSAF